MFDDAQHDFLSAVHSMFSRLGKFGVLHLPVAEVITPLFSLP
tara:strand:- start:6743 stop:6868 length:126 start_codon:yes stop_codon:yes gene_type:complete